MHWVIENDAFANGDILLGSLERLQKEHVVWHDEFWITREYEAFPKNSIFHGSLGNAARLKREMDWQPGSLCDEEEFSFSSIYKKYRDFLLNRDPVFTTISEVLGSPHIMDALSNGAGKIFARPNSPLKEFSGRVIGTKNLTPSHFDYGFYHSDMSLPIVLAEFKKIGKEFRFVCITDKIVTGCEYIADGRKGGVSIDTGEAWQFAQRIADLKMEKDLAYIIDICESDKELYLVETNPFSGSDLYACDATRIITSMEDA